MPSRSQVTLTTGESGAGKSMLRCAVFLVKDFLPDETGVHYSNFPVKFPEMSQYMGWDEEKLRARVKILPEDELRRWRDGESGPWEYFAADTNFSGCHIAIDEAHRYVSSEHTRAHIKQWKEFCGGVRHQGGTIEFLTQNEAKLHRMINLEAGEWLNIVTPARRIEPFSGAPWYDTLQIASKLRGRAVGLSFEIKHSRDSGGKKWKREAVIPHWHDPKHWELYDSYNVIADEGRVDENGAELRRPKEPWERFSWPYLLVWYLARNAVPLGLRFVIVAFVFWAFALGGIGHVVKSVLLAGMGASSQLSKQVDAKAPPDQRASRQRGEQEPTLAEPYRSATSQQDLAKLREANQQMAARLLETSQYLESLTSLTAVMLIEGKPHAFFQDGSIATINDAVPIGKYAGQKVKAIEVRKGTVTLTDGTVLRVGVLPASRLQQLREQVDQAQQHITPAVFDQSKSAPESSLRGSSSSSAPASQRSPLPVSDPAMSRPSDSQPAGDARRRLRGINSGGN